MRHKLLFIAVTLVTILALSGCAAAQQLTGNPQNDVGGSLQPTNSMLQPTTSGEVLGQSINQYYYDAANDDLEVETANPNQQLTGEELPLGDSKSDDTANRITLIGGVVGSVILIAFIAKAVAGRDKGNIFTS